MFMTAQDLVRKRIRRIFGLLFLESGGIPRSMSYTSRKSARYRNNKNYPFHKVIQKESDMLDEISPEDVSIPKQYIHDTLNKKIWDGENLRPEVRAKLLTIVKEFYEFLEIDAPIKKIMFLGSMANYNWSSQSDIDLHLFFDFSEINDDVELVKNLLDAKKTIWNDKHNINIKGYTVELYSQDLSEKNASIGQFNLYKNTWEQKPQYENFKIDKASIVTKTVSIIDQIENLENNKQLSRNEIYSKGNELKDRIKKMRKGGLERGGEFSVENLAFKYLRNNGYLERLYDLTQDAYDTNLSLTENKKYNADDIKKISDSLKIDISDYSLKELTTGFNVELEHSDITKGDPALTLKIAIAHLKEVPNYYTKLINYVEK